jgi:aspartyl-tRNA(Asn)/glutamyl-tRNA(Gln) amidotransferase subunit A
MTRTVADCAEFLRVIAGRDPRDPTTDPRPVPEYRLGQSIKGLKIGIPKEYRSDKIHPDMQKLWDDTAEKLKKEGAEITDISLPHTKYALPVYYIIAPAEASSNLARYDGVKYGYRTPGPFKSLDEMYEMTRTEGFGEEVRRRMLIGATILTKEFYERSFLKAMKVRRILRDEFAETFERVDVILTPTATGPAFDRDAKMSPVEVYLNDVYTVTANMVGVPAMSVPMGKTTDGLPLGLQLLGRWFDEQTVMNTAYAMEAIAK